jgi:hypothetical protein
MCHPPPLLWLQNAATVYGVVLERLDLAAMRRLQLLRMSGSRFWIYGRSGDGTSGDGRASDMEDELT